MPLYRQELLNVKENREDYLFALDLMFKSAVNPDPVLRWMYYSEFGPQEELEKVERDMRIIYSLAKRLRKKLEEAPEGVGEMSLGLQCFNVYIYARRGKPDSVIVPW